MIGNNINNNNNINKKRRGMRSLVNPLSLLFLSFILLINRLVNGDAVVVSPSKGEAFSPAGDIVTIPIKIIDNGEYPSMVDFTSFTILLCTGPNDNIRCFYTISQEAHLSNFVQSVEGASTFYTYDASFKSSLRWLRSVLYPVRRTYRLRPIHHPLQSQILPGRNGWRNHHLHLHRYRPTRSTV